MTLTTTAEDLQLWRDRAGLLGTLLMRLVRRGEVGAGDLEEIERRFAPAQHPTIIRLSHEQAATATDHALDQLLDLAPSLSAGRESTGRAKRIALVVLAVISVVTVLAPVTVLIVFTGLATSLYTAALAYRLWLFGHSFDESSIQTIGDVQARAIPDEDLPLYTVLVPAYREPTVIGEVVHRLALMEYPHHKLEVMLLLEEDDQETIDAAMGLTTTLPVSVVLIPPSEPRTKPKACNVGLQLCHGEYVVIFDAEDRPEALQLRRAVATFRKLGPRVACLQARLDYFNGEQNIITRWFEAEYLTWFRHLLPGIVATGGTVPLGGTSNHIRRTALDAVGAWDPHNVTEDADLGIRLSRLGYETAVLDSYTEEEANSDFVNWAKQRSRWYKGYLQTAAVHLRSPRELRRQLGNRGFLGFVMFVGGTPLLALLNPVFWALSLLYVLTASSTIGHLFPPLVYYPAMACWIVGNSSIIYSNVLTARYANRPHLIWCSLLAPIYWLMMSVAAVKAAVQFVQNPSYWEKTTHGLLVQSLEPADVDA